VSGAPAVATGVAADSGLALAARGLRKRYGARPALTGLDLAVPTGVVYGFLGPNGAGKTTTMRLLVGLIRPDAGSIELLGKPYTWRDRRRLFDVGALIETPAFYPYLSGRENLRALAATGAPVPRGRVEEVLELVALRDRAKDRFNAYSLGMKQRLGIAAALLSDPPLLLLDEPANGLDPAGIVAMRQLLRFLTSQGKTVFISSHILPEVQQLAEIVGIIHQGRLIREGSLQELLNEGGHLRVAVEPAEAAHATSIVEGVAGPGSIESSSVESGRAVLLVRIVPARAAEVNRALAQAGIYASGLTAASDLESIFLSLTGDDA